ncbi:MAG: response regulator, partial [Duncaniella sp.]|nr:response regulator [Duncaniella sp.]
MSRYKLLVVDDEDTLCEALRFNLEIEGYDVDVAHSAEEALKLNLENYSLILLDVMMGEISGFRMAQMMRANPQTADVPIIFLTAKDNDDDMIAGLKLGGDDYIT